MSTKRLSRPPSGNQTRKIQIPEFHHLIYWQHYIALKRKQRGSANPRLNPEPYYYINPLELNAGLLQYLCDTGKLSILSGRGHQSDKHYLLITDHPVIICEESAENRINDLNFTSICEVPGYDRARHQREFTSEQPIFTVAAVDTNSGEELIVRQNVNYVANIGRILRSAKSGKNKLGLGCELETGLIHETLELKDGTQCHIVGFPTYNCRQLMKEPELFDYITGTEYRKKYSELETEYIKLLGQITGRDDINTMSDFVNGGPDYLKPIYNSLTYELKAIFDEISEPESLKNEIHKVLIKKFTNLFTRPDINISYQFYVFATDYMPLIYNIRELTNDHLAILEKIKALIEIRIPEIFNILRPGETRYGNMFNYCKYGDLFSVRTEYIHPASNPSFYAHEYVRSITLEEVIYTLSLPAEINFWSRIEYTYKVKNYRIGKDIMRTKSGNNHSPRTLKHTTSGKPSGTSNYLPPHRRTGGLISTRGKYYHTIRDFTPSRASNKLALDKQIASGDKIINCQQLMDKSYEVIIWNAREQKYFLMVLNPILRNINFTELLRLSTTRNLYFSCPGIGQVYGLKSQIPVFEVSKYELCSSANKDKYFITNSHHWWFPSIKQPLPNYEFLDMLYDKYSHDKPGKFSTSYYPLLLQNRFNEPIDDTKMLNTSNTICQDKLCSEEEMKNNGYYSFKHIIVNGYKIVVNKIKKRRSGDEVKYVCWVYKLADNTGKMGPNLTRNIGFIPGKDLLMIFDALKKDQDMYSEPTGPQPKYMFVNTISFYPLDMFHIQILTDNPKQSIHNSAQYDERFSPQSETRAVSVNNIIPKISLYPDYYIGLRKAQTEILFSVCGLINI